MTERQMVYILVTRHSNEPVLAFVGKNPAIATVRGMLSDATQNINEVSDTDNPGSIALKLDDGTLLGTLTYGPVRKAPRVAIPGTLLTDGTQHA